jgi:F-box interacting protein
MYIDHHIYPSAYNLFLWNPITRESKLIPDPDPYICDSERLGFGYDPSMDDYKFIRVIKTDRMDVYSLRNNSWNTVKLDYSGLKYFGSDYNGFGVGVNGYLYWVVDHPDAKLISDLSVVGLCLRDHHMTELGMPHDMIKLDDGTGVLTTASGWGLGGIGSCLGLHSYQKPGNFVVWTLKENEERKWEKLMTLSLSLPDDKCFWLFKPEWITKEGKVVIFFVGGAGWKKRYNKLGLYDLQKKSFNYVPITGDDNSFFCTTMAHVQSLVSPNMF